MKNKSGGTENLIRKMLKKHSSPLMLIQEDALEKQFKTFRKALPEVTPYYAIKAKPYTGIIKKNNASRRKSRLTKLIDKK